MPGTVPVIFVAVQWLLICSFLQRLFRFGAERTSAAQHTGQLFSAHPVQATCLQLAAEANRSTDKAPQNVVYFARGREETSSEEGVGFFPHAAQTFTHTLSLSVCIF